MRSPMKKYAQTTSSAEQCFIFLFLKFCIRWRQKQFIFFISYWGSDDFAKTLNKKAINWWICRFSTISAYNVIFVLLLVFFRLILVSLIFKADSSNSYSYISIIIMFCTSRFKLDVCKTPRYTCRTFVVWKLLIHSVHCTRNMVP
jgi:hypothetical protein